MTDQDHPAQPPQSHWGARRIAGLLTALEALVMSGITLFYVVESARGEGSDPGIVASSALIIGLGAVVLIFMTRAWFAGAAWQRMATIVWNGILLPIAWMMLTSSRVPAGLAVGVVAIASIVAAVRAGDADVERPGRGPDITS